MINVLRTGGEKETWRRDGTTETIGGLGKGVPQRLYWVKCASTLVRTSVECGQRERASGPLQEGEEGSKG